MTKQELQEYYWTRRNIQRLEDRLLELETEATRQTTTLRDDPRGGGYSKDKLSGIVVAIVAVQDQINSQLEWSYHILAEIEKAIEVLPEREKYLVTSRYIDGKTWEQIAVDMHYSWPHVHRIHANALKILIER